MAVCNDKEIQLKFDECQLRELWKLTLYKSSVLRQKGLTGCCLKYIDRDAFGMRLRAIHALCQAMAHILTATASSAAQKKHVWRIWSKPLRK